MKKFNPKISIIVPVYLSEPFLHQCVNSLINQTLKEVEIILVNDGSPDNSGAICEEYAKKDSRIKVIHQPNQTASYALENGRSVAKGEYLMSIDADDWLNPITCELAFNSAKKHNADVVFWSYINEFPGKSVKEKSIFSQDTIFEGESLVWLKRRMMGLVGKELADPTRTDAINSTWGKIFKRKMIIESKISAINSDGSGSYDVLYVNRAFVPVQKAVYINQFLHHYRRNNPNSVTKNYGFSLWSKLNKLFYRLDELIVMNNYGQDFKVAFKNRIALSLLNNVLTITSKNNSSSKQAKLAHLTLILNDEVFKDAIMQLELKYLPIHWKLFFFAAKIRSAFGVYHLGVLMHKFRN